MKNATQSRESGFGARTPEYRWLRAGSFCGRVVHQFFAIEDGVLVFYLAIDLDPDPETGCSNTSMYRGIKW